MVHSTRSNIKSTISNAIAQGLSKDGGLFVFDTLQGDFYTTELTSLTYPELSEKVFEYLLRDYSKEQVKEVVARSYNTQNFPNEIVKLKHFDSHSYLELFHGNTFAFKDMALSTLPNLFDTAKKINNDNKKTIILTATSGDTGSAALNGFSTLEDTYVIVLYPTQGVSEFQELQMNSYQSDKRIIFAVDGNFDDCQNIVKQLFQEVQPKNISLSSANSINIGRIIPQIVYYMYSYSQLVKDNKITYGEKINITVPTGNFGNIYAGYIAKRLGVPIKKLIIASNSNNVLTDLFNKGLYKTSRELHKTISPSMDILISSNVERYLYDLENKDTDKLNEMMTMLQINKELPVDSIFTQTDFYASFCDEEKTYQTIQSVFEKDNYLIDPHTAVAKAVSDEYMLEESDETYMVIVSTANPYKFSDAIIQSLGIDDQGSLLDKFKKIESKTNLELDKRMLQILSLNTLKKEVSLKDTLETVKKVIGDIDDQN